MRLITGAAASGIFLGALQFAVPGGATATTASPTAQLEKNLAPACTFHMDVTMAMRHFPWLHFRMEGIGEYEPGQRYDVRFTSVPWFFPKSQHDVDLSMLDPAMWPRRFMYQEIGERGGDTLFSLHPLDDSTLGSATVTLGPRGKTRRVVMAYKDGTHVAIDVSDGNIDGFLMPAALTADIDEPHLALSANVDFKDYDFGLAPPLSNGNR